MTFHQLVDGDEGRKTDGAKKKRLTQGKLQTDALIQPVSYWFISQSWAPMCLPYWAHLHKNLYPHSSNWVHTLKRGSPLSHEHCCSDVSTVSITHNKVASKRYMCHMWIFHSTKSVTMVWVQNCYKCSYLLQKLHKMCKICIISRSDFCV